MSPLKIGEERARLIEKEPCFTALRSLDLQLYYESEQTLSRSLAHLEAVLHMLAERSETFELRLRLAYQPSQHQEQLTHYAVNAHQRLLERWQAALSIESYFPLCLPHMPLEQRLFTTPPYCRQCALRYRCGGLLNASAERPAAPTSGSTYATAKSDEAPLSQSASDAPTAAEINQHAPLSYWIPTGVELDEVAAALSANRVRRLWEIGGGNGFLARWVQRRSNVEVTVIEANTAYHGVTELRWRGLSIEEALAQTPRQDWPDALLISWPPIGDGFSAAVERLKPRLLIRAADVSGYCGEQARFAALTVNHAGLHWWGWPENDFAEDIHRPVHREFEASSRWNHAKAARPTRLLIAGASPWSSSAEAPPLPWE